MFDEYIILWFEKTSPVIPKVLGYLFFVPGLSYLSKSYIRYSFVNATPLIFKSLMKSNYSFSFVLKSLS